MKLNNRSSQSERGISIVEILVVVIIIGILSSITAMSLLAPEKYNAEKQAFILADLMREAQQRAISQKKTMRVEINITDRAINLINENEPSDVNNDGVNDVASANNDELIKTVRFIDGKGGNKVFVGTPPINMSSSPTELTPVVPVVISNSLHPYSLGDQVATMRFQSNGMVLNAGNNAIGTGSTPTGATIFVWSKWDSDNSLNPTIAEVHRALTVLGTSGSTKYWKCTVVSNPLTKNQCTNWTR